VWVTFTSGENNLVYETLFCTCCGVFYQEEVIDNSYAETVLSTNPTYFFDASSSYDLDGSIIFYDWNFGDGSLAMAIGEQVEHTFAEAGTYNVRLTVWDNDGDIAIVTQV